MSLKLNKYHFVKTQNSHISIASLWTSSGSSRDPSGKEGLTHLFEHLFLNHTKSLPNKKEVLRKIDSSGLFFNAYTHKNVIQYYFIQAPEKQELAYQMLISGINDFDVTQEVLDREKQTIQHEQNLFTTNPSFMAWQVADHDLWQKSLLAAPTLGTKESLDTITIKDVLTHKELLFSPEMVSFMTISPSDISNQLTSTLNELSLGSAVKFESDALFCKQSTQIICKHHSIETVFLVISFPLPKLSNLIHDQLGLNFIQSYLASGWSSRLIEKLRYEHNFTYWVTGSMRFFPEAGFFRITLSTDKKNIQDIIALIQLEIINLQTKELSASQLLDHKNAMKGHLIKRLSESENLLWWHGWNEIVTKQKYTINTYFRKIDNLSSTKILNTAIKYLSLENMHVVAFGNVSENNIDLKNIPNL